MQRPASACDGVADPSTRRSVGGHTDTQSGSAPCARGAGRRSRRRPVLGQPPRSATLPRRAHETAGNHRVGSSREGGKVGWLRRALATSGACDAGAASAAGRTITSMGISAACACYRRALGADRLAPLATDVRHPDPFDVRRVDRGRSADANLAREPRPVSLRCGPRASRRIGPSHRSATRRSLAEFERYVSPSNRKGRYNGVVTFSRLRTGESKRTLW